MYIHCDSNERKQRKTKCASENVMRNSDLTERDSILELKNSIEIEIKRHQSCQLQRRYLFQKQLVGDNTRFNDTL